jgi:hypothetical protein
MPAFVEDVYRIERVGDLNSDLLLAQLTAIIEQSALL